MKNFYILIKILLLTSCFSYGQFYDEFKKNYTPLHSTGKLPPELSQTAVDKANIALYKIPSSKNPDYNIQKEFYLNTIFDEDRLLKKGSLVFNSRINNYINTIVDTLLSDNKDLRSRLTFYVSRENEANAWAMDNGHIYISLDYIARYNTEAQLAMTLCHEITHYLNQHHYASYVKRAEIIKAMKRTYDQDSLWIKERSFYKVQESQADLEGFELFKKSRYSSKTIPEKFDLMLLCDYSFENIPYDITFLNNNAFKLNPKIFYQEIKPIRIDVNYDDTWDTHPNIYKRKKAIEDNILASEKKAGKDFVVSETEFYYVRDMARFETIITDIRDFNSPEAFYHTFCLLQKYPENDFLNRCIGSLLYQMAVFKSYSNIHGGFFDNLFSSDNAKVNANRDSTMGHLAQVKKMFKRLSGEDFTLLAINHNYSLLKKSEFKDEGYKANLDTLFNVLRSIHNLNYKDFLKTPPDERQQAIYNPESSNKNRNFVDAIEQKTAFLNYMNESTFISFFKDTTSTNEYGIKYIAKGKTNKMLPGKTNNILLGHPKHIQSNKKEIMLVKKIVVQEPRIEKTIYKKYDVENCPMEAYDNAVFFKNKLESELTNNQIQYINIGDAKFETEEIEKYNDVSLINSITSENDQHYNIPSTKVFNAKSNGYLTSKYGTSYFLQVCIYENIYDNVKFIINGMSFERDLKTFNYCFDLVNIESGISVYRRSFEASYALNKDVMRDHILIDINNIVSLKNN